MRKNPRILIAGAALVGATGGMIYGVSTSAPAVENPPVAASAPAPAPAPAVVAQKAARAVLEGVGIESGLENARVRDAMDAFRGEVLKQSHPEALQMAVRAYYKYQASHPEKVRKPYLYFVDYGLQSHEPRGYVFDMKELKVVDGPFTVAHGRGSAARSSGVPTRFSNRSGSNATSLGLYLAQETYQFRGKSGGRSYTSIGLRLAGLSGKYNSAARARGVVVHGAPYVSAGRAGRSEGCPAVEQHRAKRLIPKIANGGLVFLFSPLEKTWMEEDRWAGLKAITQPKG